MRNQFWITSALLLFCTYAICQDAPLKITVDAKPAAEIQPTMWGIFFEDINFAADGGIYAELVKNRSFEFAVPLMGWTQENTKQFSMNRESGSALVINEGVDQNNPRFARITTHADSGYSLLNEGFAGMGVKQNVVYHLTVMARKLEGNVSIRVSLVNADGNVLGSTVIVPDSDQWKKYTATLRVSATTPDAKMRMSFIGKGVTDLDFVSLFPSDTWKNRPGGLRADLVQLLYDLKPGFIRFPGGCIVEGRDLSQRYQWKKTVGDVTERQVMINRWNTEFKHRPAPDYFQSFGVGFYEYFQLAEDIGAAPLPILSCGIACQFNTGEVVPLEELDPYIQDALDLIEFANGPVTSKWGKLRADMGHPAPFKLTMIGVGNEQWGTQYIERYKIFEKAIKAKHPEIKIISSSGPGSEGELFDYAWSELKTMKAEIVDEHYYQKPDWFLKNTHRYDNYDRKGPKVFAGEYAAQSVATVSPENKNNWQCALSEAAFMTGLERNADIVHLASYAPLLAHVDKWQWTPNLIWFDNLQSFGTPSYYVQKMFANHRGTHVLKSNSNIVAENGLYVSTVWDAPTNEIIVKVVNSSGTKHKPQIVLSGKSVVSATEFVLKGDPSDVNDLKQPKAVAPKEGKLTIKGKSFSPEVEPNSLSVYRLKVR